MFHSTNQTLNRMKGWNILEREDSTVELQSIKGEELTDVLEEFAVTHQIDPLPVINKSTVILKVGMLLTFCYYFPILSIFNCLMAEFNCLPC